MKVTLEKKSGSEKEIIIKYDTMDNEIEDILEFLNSKGSRISAKRNDEIVFIDPQNILYCEYIDDIVFIYDKRDIFETRTSLSKLEKQLPDYGFFRCSKNMIVNISKIESLSSGIQGQIIATIANGEKIIISRRYAKQLRQLLLK